MSEQKSSVKHTRAVGGDYDERDIPRGEGVDITFDKSTHQMYVPRELEDEHSVTVRIVPKEGGCTKP